MSSSEALEAHAQSEVLLERYRRRTSEVLDRIDLSAVAAAVERLVDAWERGALILLTGNGGSASTASHFANDLVKATRVPGGRPFRAVSLGDNVASLTAQANDHGYESVFSAQMNGLFGPGDVLIAISASGDSPNVVAAAQRARELGGTTIALTGFTGGRLAELAQDVIHVPTEPGEYGPVEDCHLILNHMITGALLDRVRASVDGGPE